MTHPQTRSQSAPTARAHPAAATRAPAAQPDRGYGSRTGAQPATPAEMRPGPQVEESQLPDLQLYERLIDDGIAAADARGTAVDHVTARRLAICLAARPQAPVLAQNLVRFIRTGTVSHALKTQLRIHARSATYADQPQAARLMEYCIARGTELGPVGENFGAACDQIDRADKLLVGAHARARHRGRAVEPSWPETEGPRITALVRHDSETGMVTLVLDATRASAAMFALTAHAGEREAHAREVERSGSDWPEGSYGRRNRQAIAARETRVATRLRAVQDAYQAVADHSTAFRRPNSPGHPVLPGMRPTRRSNLSKAPSQRFTAKPNRKPDRRDPRPPRTRVARAGQHSRCPSYQTGGPAGTSRGRRLVRPERRRG